MKREILTSTGTMVSRLNNYDYKRAMHEAALLCADGLSCGIELMMLKFYYDKYPDVVSEIRKNQLKAPVIHCEKDVGSILSDAGKSFAEGNAIDGKELQSKAEELFRLNCKVGELAGSGRMVLHLWGGLSSDSYIDYNISVLPKLQHIASESGIRLLIENIPSVKYDPLSNWKRIISSDSLNDSGFIFDTRFGMLHEQADAIFSDSGVAERIEHIHISDFGGTYREFSALRPILHPGEGKIDFLHIASLLDSVNYAGTITLESPVNVDAELDIPKLRRTLKYLNQIFN